MNWRPLLHGISIIAAIGMVVAAFMYRDVAQSQASANLRASEYNLEKLGTIDGTIDDRSENRQQERLARLQYRL